MIFAKFSQIKVVLLASLVWKDVGAVKCPDADLIQVQTGPDVTCGGGNSHYWPVSYDPEDCHGWQDTDPEGKVHDNAASNMRCEDGKFKFTQYAGNLICGGTGVDKVIGPDCEEDIPPTLHSIGADLSCCIDPNSDACLYGQPTAKDGAAIFFNGEECDADDDDDVPDGSGSGSESVPSDDSGSKNVPSDDSGSKNVPSDDSGSKSVPSDDGGSKSVPSDDSGSKSKPTADDSGSKSKPTDDRGSKSIPFDDSGSKSIPSDDSGSKSIPTDDSGSKSKPNDGGASKSKPTDGVHLSSKTRPPSAPSDGGRGSKSRPPSAPSDGGRGSKSRPPSAPSDGGRGSKSRPPSATSDGERGSKSKPTDGGRYIRVPNNSPKVSVY